MCASVCCVYAEGWLCQNSVWFRPELSDDLASDQEESPTGSAHISGSSVFLCCTGPPAPGLVQRPDLQLCPLGQVQGQARCSDSPGTIPIKRTLQNQCSGVLRKDRKDTGHAGATQPKFAFLQMDGKVLKQNTCIFILYFSIFSTYTRFLSVPCFASVMIIRSHLPKAVYYFDLTFPPLTNKTLGEFTVYKHRLGSYRRHAVRVAAGSGLGARTCVFFPFYVVLHHEWMENGHISKFREDPQQQPEVLWGCAYTCLLSVPTRAPQCGAGRHPCPPSPPPRGSRVSEEPHTWPL